MSTPARRTSPWLLLLLLPIAGFSIWWGYRQTEAPAEEKKRSNAAAIKSLAPGKFLNEEHWLVDETARTITELLTVAKDPATAPTLVVTPPASAGESYRFTAKLKEAAVDGSLTLKAYLWSPDDYADWTHALLTGWKLTPPPSSAPSENFLSALTTPTPDILQRENKRLSGALTQTPLDASLHEEAALLIATFALHDSASTLGDVRRELCHVAAHLAIAQGLNSGALSPTGLLAEAALETLAGRETAALQRLSAIEPKASPPQVAWISALRLRNTGDWRKTSTEPTLLEQIESFRARAQSVSCDFANEVLEKSKPAPIHDWRRIILETHIGVEIGHKFASDSIPQEIESLRTDWQAYFGSPLEQNDLVKALNEPAGHVVSRGAGGAATVHVLGWDFWSAQHQRQFCQAIRASNCFLRDYWGVNDYQDLQKGVNRTFADLTLFPLLENELTDQPADFGAISTRVRALIDAHPELITPSIWVLCREKTIKGFPPLDVPSPVPWFHPLLPFGTTYDFDGRSTGFALPGGQDPWWNQLIAMAPSNFRIRTGRAWKTYQDNVPPDFAETIYGPLQEYHLGALRQIAKAEAPNSSEAYEATMGRICALDPNRYFELADWYRDHQRPEQAAEADQKGVDLAPDRVLTANRCNWLVFYLEDHGQGDRAMAIAQMAGEVYSHSGLRTLAQLLEKRGKLTEAEENFKNIAERYDNKWELNYFYLRHRTDDPRFEAAVAAGLQEAFPNGVKTVALGDFSGPPESGVLVTATTPRANQYGLRAGDIFVAIDGHRTESMPQYNFARGLSDDPKFTVIVWSSGSYREVQGNSPDRLLGVTFETYPRKAGSGK